MKILIGCPTLDFVAADFAMALAAMMATPQHYRKLGKQHPIKLGLCHVANSNYTDARNSICEQALSTGVDRVLMLDSDMAFPTDTIERLASHKAAIVGASYVTRDRAGTNRLLGTMTNGQPLSLAGAGPLLPVANLPFGCMMVSTDVLRQLPRPWFRYPMTDSHTRSEDIYFCDRAREATIPIYCDTILTRELGHIGVHHYKL